MTQYPDKPKRKEKPKRRPSHAWLFLVLLLIFLILLGLYVLFSLQENGDGWTPNCEFNSNPHIYVSVREGTSYITDFSGQTRIDVPDTFRLPTWSVDSPYLWGGSGEPGQVIINLETETVTSFTEHNTGGNYYSSTLRYLIKFGNYDDGERYFILYDAQVPALIVEEKTPASHVNWSRDDNFVLLFNRFEPTQAQIMDMTSLTLSDVTLPSDVGQTIGWLDNDHIIYRTKASRIRVWDRFTDDTQAFTDVRFDEYYISGGETNYFNLQFYMPFRRWITGIDPNDNFHLFNVWDTNQHITFPIDTSEEFSYTVENQYVKFEYQTEPKLVTIYHPDTNLMADIALTDSHNLYISPTGKYTLSYPTDGSTETHVVQEVMTGDTMKLEEDNLTALEWVDIQGQPYLLYAIPIDSGANIFYLLEPNAKERCKVGTFYTDNIKILT